MNADLAIRFAATADLDAMAAIYEQAFDDLQPRLAVEQYLRPSGSWALVATIGENAAESVVGYVLARTAAAESEIFSLGVLPSNRRRGTGTALLAAARRISEMRGAGAVFLEVGEDNEGARALYEKCGYDIVGRRADYYRNKGGERVAALIMRQTLGIQGVDDT